MTLCMGDGSTLMVTEDGDISVFGRNSHGRLGLGHADKVIRPTLLTKDEFAGVDVVMTSAGHHHSACVTSTGALWMWGECGIWGNRLQLFVPTPVLPQLKVLMVACGADFTMVLTREKRVWTCGEGRNGQLGHNNTESSISFAQVDPELFGTAATVSTIAAGYRNAMALTTTTAGNTLWTWGRGECGILGHGHDTKDRLVPVAIPATTFGGVPVMSMDSALQHTLVVTADGALWGCGSDYFGALGLHKDGIQGIIPDVHTLQKVVGPEFADGTGVLMAACGQCHSVVLAKNHTVWVCGGKSKYFFGGYSGTHWRDYPFNLRSLTLINPKHFRGRKVLVVAGGIDECGVVTEDGDVHVCGVRGMFRPDLDVRIGRWHNLRLDHAVAFGMMFDKRLGAEASPLKGLPVDVLESIFGNMHLQPHADTPDALHNMLGRQPPMLPQDEDEEYSKRRQAGGIM